MNKMYYLAPSSTEMLCFKNVSFYKPTQIIEGRYRYLDYAKKNEEAQWKNPITKLPIEISFDKDFTKTSEKRPPKTAVEFMYAHILSMENIKPAIQENARNKIIDLLKIKDNYVNESPAIYAIKTVLATEEANYNMVDDTVYQSIEKIEEKIKDYVEAIEFYENYKGKIKEILKEISELTNITPATIFATNKKGASINLKSVRKELFNEELESLKSAYPETVEELKKVLLPLTQELSSYSINSDFRALLSKKLLPIDAEAFVPFSCLTIRTQEVEAQLCRFYLNSSTQDFEHSWFNKKEYPDNITSEAIFLTEDAVKNYIENSRSQDYFGNTYLCIKNGYVQDIRWSNENEEIPEHVKEFLIVLEKDRLLDQISLPSINPDTDKKKIKI